MTQRGITGSHVYRRPPCGGWWCARPLRPGHGQGAQGHHPKGARSLIKHHMFTKTEGGSGSRHPRDGIDTRARRT